MPSRDDDDSNDDGHLSASLGLDRGHDMNDETAKTARLMNVAEAAVEAALTPAAWLSTLPDLADKGRDRPFPHGPGPRCTVFLDIPFRAP